MLLLHSNKKNFFFSVHCDVEHSGNRKNLQYPVDRRLKVCDIVEAISIVHESVFSILNDHLVWKNNSQDGCLACSLLNTNTIVSQRQWSVWRSSTVIDGEFHANLLNKLNNHLKIKWPHSSNKNLSSNDEITGETNPCLKTFDKRYHLEEVKKVRERWKKCKYRSKLYQITYS